MADDQQQSTAPPQDDAEASQWRERATQAERELALRRAISAVDWFDPEDAYRELSARAEQDENGQWHVRDPKSDQRSAPADAARDLARSKPHWVRARIVGGTGAGGGSGSPGAGGSGVTYAELLRPENSAKLREYIGERPEELERLRQSHFKR